jgi:DNA-binding beta-propeller fold protein YncE
MATGYSSVFATLCKVLVAIVLSLILLAASGSNGGYGVKKKIPIPGQGSWDYLTVDEAARRLYVSHGNQVEVLDVDSGALVGKIENTLGVHGIAIVPELGRGFVSNGQSSTVTIFDFEDPEHDYGSPYGQEARCNHL